MNSYTLKDMCSSKWLCGLAVILCVSAVVVTLSIVSSGRPRQIVRSADEETSRALKAYSEGTFRAATNALVDFVQYLEARKRRLSPYRDVDLMLYVAHAKLSYMLLCVGNETGACTHLTSAYSYHREMAIRNGGTSRPPAEFVKYVIAGIENSDIKSEPAWKAEFTLNTNMVEKAKIRFLSRTVASPGRNTN